MRTGRLLITGSKLNNWPTLVINNLLVPCLFTDHSHSSGYLVTTYCPTYQVQPTKHVIILRWIAYQGEIGCQLGWGGFGSLSPPVFLSCCFSTLHQNMWWSLLLQKKVFACSNTLLLDSHVLPTIGEYFFEPTIFQYKN